MTTRRTPTNKLSTAETVIREEAPAEETNEILADALIADEDAAPIATLEPQSEQLSDSLPTYLDDDDDSILLKAADSRLDETSSYGIFKQEEGVISWTITNFIDADGKQYGKRELRANPPVLTFESSTGDKADFVLSKEFSASLASVLERVHYGYFGLESKPKKKYTWAEAKQAIINAIGARPLPIGAFLLLTIVVTVGLIAS